MGRDKSNSLNLSASKKSVVMSKKHKSISLPEAADPSIEDIKQEINKEERDDEEFDGEPSPIKRPALQTGISIPTEMMEVQESMHEVSFLSKKQEGSKSTTHLHLKISNPISERQAANNSKDCATTKDVKQETSEQQPA